MAGGGTGATGDVGNQPTGGRLNPDIEPAGDNVLTIVNGVVDADGVALCFARVNADGQTSELTSDPLPVLPYAHSTVLTTIDGLSFVDDSIQPWVIAGDLTLIEKLDCAGAVALAQSEEAKVTPDFGASGEGGAPNAGGAAGAGGVPDDGFGNPTKMVTLVEPTLRARPLAALPAGSVDVGRSMLMVLTGCLGGAFYTDHIETAVCGEDYAPDRPSVQPVVVKLSRDVRYDKVGLQGLHASQTTPSLDIRVGGPKDAIALVFASSVDYGMIAPKPADTRFTPEELNLRGPLYGLQAVGDAGVPVYQSSWPDVLETAGLETVTAGRTYTAIFVGPDPLVIKEGFWNAPAFTLVDNDPTRE